MDDLDSDINKPQRLLKIPPMIAPSPSGGGSRSAIRAKEQAKRKAEAQQRLLFMMLGGALILNDPALVERAHIVQEKGTDRSRFLMGQVDKYTWVDRGSSYLLGELPAALLYSNLRVRAQTQAIRLSVWDRYQNELRDWAVQRGIGQPGSIAGAEHPAHLYWLMMPDLEARYSLTAHLRERGVSCAYHYQPLHLSPMGLKYGGRPGQCPNAEKAAMCLIRLPLHAALSEPDVDRILKALWEWR